MRFILTNIIVLCGRYSVLLLIPLVSALVWVWLYSLDNNSILGIVLMAPVILVVVSTVVLVLGILLAGVPRHEGVTVSPEDVPELWDYWNRVSPASPDVVRQIIVDGEINAAMAERSRVAGLFGRDQTLVVGIGLMVLLDRPAVEAILEHEFAHAELRHSHGLTRLVEFFQTYEAFEDYLEDDLPWAAILLAVAFQGIRRWLKPEILLRSKRHEFEADRQSADRVGVDTQGAALMLVEGAGASADMTVYEPLEIELRGALKAPEPPLDRLIRMRADLMSPDNLKKGVDKALAEDADPESTHPPLKERLENIGAGSDMKLRPVGPSAFETMVPQETRERLLGELNKQWTAAVNRHVGIW